MNREQPPRDENEPDSWIDRWPMEIIRTHIPNQPTTNHGDVIQFMAQHEGCDFEVREMPDEQGRKKLYMVALPPRGDESDHYSI